MSPFFIDNEAIEFPLKSISNIVNPSVDIRSTSAEGKCAVGRKIHNKTMRTHILKL